MKIHPCVVFSFGFLDEWKTLFNGRFRCHLHFPILKLCTLSLTPFRRLYHVKLNVAVSCSLQCVTMCYILWILCLCYEAFRTKPEESPRFIAVTCRKQTTLQWNLTCSTTLRVACYLHVVPPNQTGFAFSLIQPQDSTLNWVPIWRISGVRSVLNP